MQITCNISPLKAIKLPIVVDVYLDAENLVANGKYLELVCVSLNGLLGLRSCRCCRRQPKAVRREHHSRSPYPSIYVILKSAVFTLFLNLEIKIYSRRI